MDVKRASQRTVDSAVNAISLARDAEQPAKARVSHLRCMNRRIQSGEVAGEKAQRWLGWMQAVAYLRSGGSHELMQTINEES